MTSLDLVGLVASIASLILAIGAIWLSITFFKMSSEAARSTSEAAKGVDASVVRLEKVFDKLYADTFSMMKDTVTDMRKHIWSKPEDNNSGISDDLRTEIRVLVAEALGDQATEQPEKQADLAKKLELSLEELLAKTKEQNQAVQKDTVLTAIRTKGPITLEHLAGLLGVNENQFANSVFKLREEGQVTWPGPGDMLEFTDLIEYCGED